MINIRVKDKSLRKSSKVRAFEAGCEEIINRLIPEDKLQEMVETVTSDLMLYGTCITDGDGNRVDPSKMFKNRLCGKWDEVVNMF